MNSVWRDHRFIWIALGQTVSQFGTAMTAFVLPWFLLELTGSAAQAGILFAVGFIPYIIVALPAGAFADRSNRKALMMTANGSRLILLASIPAVHFVTGTLPLYLLYTVQVGVSGFSAVFDAAYGPVLPAIVSPNHLQAANSTLQAGTSVSRVAGPVLGGVIVSLIGPANAVLVDVFSYVVSIVTIVPLTLPSLGELVPARQSLMRDIHEGIRTLWKIKPIRSLMVSSFFVNLVGPGMDVALLYRIQHDLNLKTAWAGIIMTGLSIGMLLGSLVNQRIGKKLDMEVWLRLSAALQIIPPILLAFIKNPIAITIIQVFIGVLLAGWNIQSVTLRQTLIPNALLGRCTSVFRLSAWISIPVGDGVAGALSQGYGTQVYFFISACVLLVAFILKMSLNPEKAARPIQADTSSRM